MDGFGTWNVFRHGSPRSDPSPQHDAMTFLAGLGTNLLILLVFVAVLVVAYLVARSIFGTDTPRATATEVGARLVSLPTGSRAALRRRFVRSLTAQHVVMPGGERLAYAALVVRVAPEDLERLDPECDLQRLGEHAARAYRQHAERANWRLPARTVVTVEVDPVLRPGWVPPARGTGAASVPDDVDAKPANGQEGSSAGPGWEVLDEVAHRTPVYRAPAPSEPRVIDATSRFIPGAAGDATVAVADLDPAVRISCGTNEAIVTSGRTVIMGRHAGSPVPISDRRVSSQHAALRYRDGEWQIQDVGSTNGTTLDGAPLRPGVWVSLPNGARVELAKVVLSVSVETDGTVALDSIAAPN